MNEYLMQLILASALFVGSHILLAAPVYRSALCKRLGEWGFRGLYSLISIALMAWMIKAYTNAPDTPLWDAPKFFTHGSLSLTLIAIFLIVCGYTTPNPGIMGMEKSGLKSGARGVLKITRHPVMWGVALWSIAHALSNGHLSALIFYGSLAVLALAGASHLDHKKTAQLGDDWRAYMAVTSHVPLAAIMTGRTRVEKGEIRWWQTVLSVLIYAGLLFGHDQFFGPYVLPL